MIHFFTGKGGVGKTTLCCLTALKQASQGKKVLLVTLDSKGSIPLFFKTKKLTFKPKKLSQNIDAVLITPKLSLREHVIKQIKFTTLFDLFFDNRVLNFFLDAAPGISEVALIGKIYYLEQQTSRNKPKWDTIIVDTPATGHGLYLFKSPKVFLDIAQSGPIAQRTQSLYEMMCEPDRATVHIVTLPEELPTQETLDLFSQIKKMKLPLGQIFMNKLLPSHDVLQFSKFKSTVKNYDVSKKIEVALLKYKTRVHLQKKHTDHLEKKLSLKVIPVEWQLSQDMDITVMKTMAEKLPSIAEVVQTK